MVKKRAFHLVCSPFSGTVEVEVNKILDIYSAEKTEVDFLNMTTGTYYNRRLEMTCQKCASEVVEASGQYACTSCGRTYTKADFEHRAKTVFSPAGILFLQPLIVTINEEATPNGNKTDGGRGNRPEPAKD